MAAPATPYIGAQISLVSKSEIRYEGTLHFVDAEQSTLALKNVKSFGTEGRKQDGPQIPPSSEVYDVVSFRGSDIKDLTVLQSPVGGSTPNQAPAAEAPTAQPPYTTPYTPMSGMYAPTGGYMSGYPPAMYGAPQYGGAMYSGQYPMQTYPMPTGQAPPESSAPAAPAPPTAAELSEQAKPPPKADGQAQAGTGPSSQTTAGAGRGRGASSKPQQPTLPGSKPAWQGRGASIGAPTGRPAPGKGAWGKPVSAPNQAASSAAAKPPPPVSKQDSDKPRSTPKAPVDSISQKQPSKPAEASQPKPRPASFAAAVGGAKSTAPARQAQPPRRGAPPVGKVNGGAPQQAAPVPVPNEEFDFESLLARFNKEELKRQEKVVVQTYNKDDFFDTMSSDALDKSKRNAHFVEQRKIDLETFGTTGDPSRFARPGGDRGRGRGTGSGGRSSGGRKPDGGQGGRGGGRGSKKTGGRG